MNETLEKLISEAPKPFIPQKLPFNTFDLITPEIFKLIAKANNALGSYTGFLINTPNPSLLLTPITTQEAVLSSKLEGTHATLEDILNHEAGNPTKIQSDEIKEILNYRDALNYSMENITPKKDLSRVDSKSPLTIKTIKEMHKILLNNVRGSTKHPGQFKMGQNYIGSYQHVSFTPLPVELTDEYMGNLEVYIHYEDCDSIVQAAIIHAQFEMIHPFEDGNGRIGRLLIPLFLYYSDLIPLPMFYMSSYFENDRAMYIQKLSNISQNNAWSEWIIYFLQGVITQSKVNTAKAIDILNLYNDYKNHADKVKSYCYILIVDFIFQHPIFTAKYLFEYLKEHYKISLQTVYNVLNKMVKMNLLAVTTGTTNKSYVCDNLLKIVTA